MAQIVLTVQNEKVADLKAGFLKEHPIPTELVEGERQPICSEIEWIKRMIIQYVIGEYIKGKKGLAIDAANVDEGIMG